MKNKEDLYKRKETRLLKGSLLKFENNIKPKDLADIIFLLLKINYYDSNQKETTYSSKTNRKSGNFRARSIEDMFRVSRTYIPTIKYKDIQQVADHLESNGIIRGHYCCTCGKKVFTFIKVAQTVDDLKTKIDDLNIKVK